MADKRGIDMHGEYQPNVNFASVKAGGIDYVILHAGYGDALSYPRQKDPKFDDYYTSAKAAGLGVGAYWYSYAQSAEAAKREAESCISMLKGKKLDYPIYFDLEESSQFAKGKAFCDSIITAFCSALEKAGYFAGLYCSTSWLNDRVSPEVAKKYALWVAQYNTRCTYTAAPYGMWQYSSKGSVPGVTGSVDLDICYVDYPKQIKAAGKNGYTKPDKNPLDTTGFKRGNKSLGVYYLKRRLMALGYKLDDNESFGSGTEKAVNDLLRKWGYKENGVAGEKFAKFVMK